MLYFSIQNASRHLGQVSSGNGRVQFCNLQFHGGTMVGSCSDHARIVRHCK